MSTITSPILLDKTGQDIKNTLKGIQDVLLAQNTLIDDESTASNRVWSSQKVVESLATTETTTGSSVTITPISSTPVIIETDVAEAATLILTQTNGTKTLEREIYIPVPGRFVWNTGVLTLKDDNTVSLVGEAITALSGINTFTINVGTINVTYRVIGSSSSTALSWDVIYGGNAAKEV